MCRDIINPMVKTLKAQEKRINILRKSIKWLGNSLLNKMA